MRAGRGRVVALNQTSRDERRSVFGRRAWPAGLFIFGEGLLDVEAFGDECAEVCGPVFAGVLLHLLVFLVFGGAGVDESGDVRLVGRRLDADGERGCGAGGVLGFVAADGVSESVFGDGPRAVERVAVGGSGEQGRGAGYLPLRGQCTGIRDQGGGEFSACTLGRAWFSDSRSFDFARGACFAQDDIVVSCG